MLSWNPLRLAFIHMVGEPPRQVQDTLDTAGSASCIKQTGTAICQLRFPLIRAYVHAYMHACHRSNVINTTLLASQQHRNTSFIRQSGQSLSAVQRTFYATVADSVQEALLHRWAPLWLQRVDAHIMLFCDHVKQVHVRRLSILHCSLAGWHTTLSTCTKTTMLHRYTNYLPCMLLTHSAFNMHICTSHQTW